jgi:hypothetical protein
VVLSDSGWRPLSRLWIPDACAQQEINARLPGLTASATPLLVLSVWL